METYLSGPETLQRFWSVNRQQCVWVCVCVCQGREAWELWRPVLLKSRVMHSCCRWTSPLLHTGWWHDIYTAPVTHPTESRSTYNLSRVVFVCALAVCEALPLLYVHPSNWLLHISHFPQLFHTAICVFVSMTEWKSERERAEKDRKKLEGMKVGGKVWAR